MYVDFSSYNIWSWFLDFKTKSPLHKIIALKTLAVWLNRTSMISNTARKCLDSPTQLLANIAHIADLTSAKLSTSSIRCNKTLHSCIGIRCSTITCYLMTKYWHLARHRDQFCVIQSTCMCDVIHTCLQAKFKNWPDNDRTDYTQA